MSETKIVCPSCAAINLLPSERLGDGPRCGKCHEAIFSAHPAELTAGTFQRHITRNDIPVLVETFLGDFAIQNRARRKKITSEALEILGKYTWPGNVRELKNLVERLAILVEADAIDSRDIPDAYNLDSKSENNLTDYQFLNFDTLKEARSAFEQAFINRKLIQHGNNVTKTAEAIGVGRSFLHKRIKSFKDSKL